MNENINKVLNSIHPLIQKLNNHPLYNNLNSIEDIKSFMEVHVYAVWDFMSLLKSLQSKLTCTSIPWIPSSNNKAARLINQIVVDEESDLNVDGVPKSHFEMYLEAMDEIKADISEIDRFINQIYTNDDIIQSINSSKLEKEIKDFLQFTFSVINRGKAHEIAAAFTFGREEIIPDMFLKIIKNTEKEYDTCLRKINYYLERHIELDGDEHGPLAHEMIANLCGEDPIKWQEVIQTSKHALEHRIALWSLIDKKVSANLKFNNTENKYILN